jgi:hypothetical protein
MPAHFKLASEVTFIPPFLFVNLIHVSYNGTVQRHATIEVFWTGARNIMLLSTDVSEEHFASIIRVEMRSELEVKCSYETLVPAYKTSQRYNPTATIDIYSRENFKTLGLYRDISYDDSSRAPTGDPLHVAI